MKSFICSSLITSLLSFILFFNTCAYASSWDEMGPTLGQSVIDLDLALSPDAKINNDQSYLIGGDGNTQKLGFYGDVTHELYGRSRTAYGLMYNVISNDLIDLSTVIGLQDHTDKADVILPQIIYTIKLSNGFDIVGNSIFTFNSDDKINSGLTIDIAFRIPVPQNLTPSFLKHAKIAIGGFRNTEDKWLPTYSLDVKF